MAHDLSEDGISHSAEYRPPKKSTRTTAEEFSIPSSKNSSPLNLAKSLPLTNTLFKNSLSKELKPEIFRKTFLIFTKCYFAGAGSSQSLAAPTEKAVPTAADTNQLKNPPPNPMPIVEPIASIT